MAHDVFISYASQDKTAADAACALLETRKIRCWIAPRDVMPGKEYAEALIDGIVESKVMVLVFTSHTNASIHQKREVERAAAKGIPIIPFRLEDVPPSKTLEYFVSQHHWLDALTPPLENHLKRLAETLLFLLEKPVEPDATASTGVTAAVQKTTPEPPTWAQQWRWPIAAAAALVVIGLALVLFVLPGSNGDDGNGNGVTSDPGTLPPPLLGGDKPGPGPTPGPDPGQTPPPGTEPGQDPPPADDPPEEDVVATTGSLGALMAHIYQIEFRGGEHAEVTVDGDGAADLDLFVFDEEGLEIALDRKVGPRCHVVWPCDTTAVFTVQVHNYGEASSTYALRTGSTGLRQLGAPVEESVLGSDPEGDPGVDQVPTGEATHTDRVAGHSLDYYDVVFQGGQTAEVAVIGQGATDLDLEVWHIDDEELIVSDLGAGDQCSVVWIPQGTARYRIIVKNLGTVWNRYSLILGEGARGPLGAKQSIALATDSEPVSAPVPEESLGVRFVGTVQGGKTGILVIRFLGSQEAWVLVEGDGSTDLDLVVLDADQQAVTDDQDVGDRCVVGWMPSETGVYYVKILNLGSKPNAYTLVTSESGSLVDAE